MANTSVSGLVSGLDTSTIISQLMQIEAQPQTDLKNRVTTETSEVTALQSINSKLAAISTKAADLAKISALSPTKATSSDGVIVSAGASATAGSVSINVGAVATSYQAKYATNTTLGTQVATPNTYYTVHFADGRDDFTFNTGDGTLSTLASALNGSNSGVTASLTRSGTSGSTPTYNLTATALDTGLGSSFTIKETYPADPANPAEILGGPSTPVAGSNAKITVDGTDIEQASNTFTGLMPEVDVTVSKTGTATVTVSRDTQSVSDAMKSLVDSVNAVLAEIDTDTAFDAGSGKGGVLSGDTTLQSVRDKLLSLVSQGIDGKSLATVGLQVDRSGRMTFDATAFQNSYTSDPAGTINKLALTKSTNGSADHIGFVAGLANVTKMFSDPYDGIVTSAITGRNASIKTMNDDIADWDVRLADRQAAMQRQYSALEVALGQMQNQASWLNGQIASLPSAGA